MSGSVTTFPSFIHVRRESDGKLLVNGGHIWEPYHDKAKCSVCGEHEPHTKGREEYEN